MAPIKTQKNHHSSGVDVDVSSVLGAGSGKIRKKIRDIERLLAKKRDVLSADMILANERALESLKMELDSTLKTNKVKEIAKKYHMVRFFEKKKALRRYKQEKKVHDALVEENKEKKEIKKSRTRLRHAEVDLCYTVNFPKDKKYISLFPNQSDNNKDENAKKGLKKTEEQRNTFKKEIESMLKEDKLPISLDDILSGKAGERTTLSDNFESQAVKETALDAVQEVDDFFE